MSSRGGRGGGGGRRGGGDFNRGGGRAPPRGYVGGRGRGGGEERFAPPPRPDPAIVTLGSGLPSVRSDLTSSSSLAIAPTPSTLAERVESLTIGDQAAEVSLVEEPLAVAATTSPVTLAPSSTKAMRHPPRPNFGTVGTKCMVRANHFLVEVADRNLHHYDVRFFLNF